MCLNWKVLVGLGLVGVGIWVIAPNLFLAALPILLLAACPLSMLAMMWGMKHVMQPGQNDSHSPQAGLTMGRRTDQEERLAELKAQQSAIGREIAQLEQGSQQGIGEGASVLRPNDGNSIGRP
jgi:hypothetical protein